MRRIGWLLAFLLFLQSLAFSAAPQAGAAHAELGGAAFSQSGNCAPEDMGGGKAPTGYHHTHCCILCSAHAELLAPLIALVVVHHHFAATDAAILVVREELKGGPSGWMSSWSSRAPPSFS